MNASAPNTSLVDPDSAAAAVPRMHPILEELAAVIADSLVRDSLMSREGAPAAAESIVDRLRDHFRGGARIYIPTSKFTVAYMVEQIRRRWNRANTRELCRELGISESRLRQLADTR